MKYLFSILFAFSLLACADGRLPDGSTQADIEASRKAGERDANTALSFGEQSMQREGAILAIRAKETRLRNAGRPYCADAYVAAADSVLRPTF